MSRSKSPLTTALAATKPALRSALGLSVFINVALFAGPLYTLQVYDRVLSSRSLATLAMLTLIVAAFLILYGILEWARSGILVRGGVRFHEVLARPLFDVALRAELAGRPSQGNQALKDAETLRETLAGGTVSTLFDIPWTPVFVGICFLFHPAMGVVALTGATLIFACALVTEFVTRDGLTRANRHAGESVRFSSDALRNAEAVSGLGMGEAVLLRWLGIQNATLAAQSAASEQAAVILATTKVVRMFVQIALIGVGAWLAIDRLISPGIMMAAMIIMGRALAPVEHVVANWKRIVAARAAATRLEELFQSLPAAPAATLLPEPRGDLRVENLLLRATNGGTAILKDVTFALDAGTSLAVIGPSGGGKSSLIKTMAGIWKPSLGAVRLDGAALSQWDVAQLGRAIGYLPQEVEFFAGTVATNIARLGHPDDQAVIAAAQSAGVHEAILKLPQGYQTTMGDGATVLSGGMRQRLALARALYGNPRLVIMDEPNSNLDAEGDAALADALRRLKAENRTVVVVTHKPQLVAHVDKVLVLAGGKVQLFGDRAEVLTKLNGPKIAALKRRPVLETVQKSEGADRGNVPAA